MSCDSNTHHLQVRASRGRLPARGCGAARVGPVPGRQGPGRQVQLPGVLQRPLQAPGCLEQKTGRDLRPQRKYDRPKTDEEPSCPAGQDRLRRAGPTETIVRPVDRRPGNDQAAVTAGRIPPAYFNQIRMRSPTARQLESPSIEYLVPNYSRMTNAKVREALEVATKRRRTRRSRWREARAGSRSSTRPGRLRGEPGLLRLPRRATRPPRRRSSRRPASSFRTR